MDQKKIEKYNTDLIMPLDVLRNKELNADEKIFLATYYMANNDIKEAERYMYDYTENQLRRIKKSLTELGYIKKVYYTPDELKEKTIRLSHTGDVCEWCGCYSYVLQKHHFPIPAKDGGTEVVNICPNCHYTFHSLEGTKYE